VLPSSTSRSAFTSLGTRLSALPPLAPPLLTTAKPARHFHSETDLVSHLSSRTHHQLSDAFHRGSLQCALYAFRLMQLSLLHYPVLLPRPVTLDAGQEELCARMCTLTSADRCHDAMLQMRQAIEVQESQRSQRRFFDALDNGLASVLEYLREYIADGGDTLDDEGNANLERGIIDDERGYCDSD
jgi:hypothetical protein